MKINPKRNRILAELKELAAEEGGTEAKHLEADELLLELIGDQEIRQTYNAIEKWYA